MIRINCKGAPMPIEYTINGARGFIHTRGWGSIGNTEYQAYIADLVADPAVRPGMKQLSDWRAVTHVDVTAETMRAIAETVRTFIERQDRQPNVATHQLAIVASHDIVYGLGRMYQLLSEEQLSRLAVFFDMYEALAWLNVAPSEEQT